MKKNLVLILIIVVIAGGFTAKVFWKDIDGYVSQSPTTQNKPLPVSPGQNDTDLALRVPDGFRLNIFADKLGTARALQMGPDGYLMVSLSEQGQIVGLKDSDGDGVADERVIMASGLNKPQGMTAYCEPGPCTYYIAESQRVAAYDYNENDHTFKYRETLFDLPGGGRHFTRSITMLPWPRQDEMLVSVGSSCDTCLEDDWRRAKILVGSVNGGELRTFASGLRNATFMTLHPVTGDVWATEMGRDLLGNDLPPDEINIIEENKNYGWPTCYGQNIHDTVFDKSTYIRNPCMDPFEVASFIDIPAHSAPLGLSFIPEEGWPEEYWYNLLVAYHGSWNRTPPTGYKIVRYKMDAQGNVLGTEDFISGWMTQAQKVLGRPVDILVQPGGTLYISDDYTGTVYRLSLLGSEPPATQQDELQFQQYKDLVRITLPLNGATVTSPLKVTGEARGNWYFEASFPVKILDSKRNEIVSTFIMSTDNWMTENYVPFEKDIPFKTSDTEGFLVIHKDNPSGLPEHDDSFEIPLRFR